MSYTCPFKSFHPDYLEDKHYKVTVVDVYTKKCGPCRAISPKIEELSRCFPTAKFLGLDADEYSKQADAWGIEHVPTFMVFKRGELVKKIETDHVKKLKSVLSEIC